MRKVTKTNIKNNVVLKENEKKSHQIRHDVHQVTFKYLLTYFTCTFLRTLQQVYNKIHLNNVLVLIMFLKLIQHLVLCCCYTPRGRNILFSDTYVMNIRRNIVIIQMLHLLLSSLIYCVLRCFYFSLNIIFKHKSSLPCAKNYKNYFYHVCKPSW